LPDFVKSHPVISVVLLFSVIAAVGFTAYTYSQGTFVDDQGCAWTAFENPETRGNFTSVEQVKNYFDSHGEQIPANLSLQERDGIVYHNIPGECGEVGGETS